ncbi:hypothetical protein [Desulfuromonas sp. AOP6]|uniref:hypothetical protein n=1 Tax=Desulfuromonas sp. AOP6 TaxID=1566351 RepID=UPI001277F140|nr:hypothetical protein [Desulfuromonas sp. AOP6]BCA80993.1 hypothetical protein AOP6_2780 [Desulfuromonas sp. AOP6]
MEDLWKLHTMEYRLADLAERAEYEKIVRRFHEEEKNSLRSQLLYNQASLRPIKKLEPEQD